MTEYEKELVETRQWYYDEDEIVHVSPNIDKLVEERAMVLLEEILKQDDTYIEVKNNTVTIIQYNGVDSHNSEVVTYDTVNYLYERFIDNTLKFSSF